MEWLALVLAVGGIIALIIRYPEKAKTAAKTVVTLGVIAWAVIFIRDKKEEWDRSYVRIHTHWEPNECRGSYFPIKVVIHNTSSKELREVSYVIEGTQKGYSVPAFEGTGTSYKIVAPQQIDVHCNWQTKTIPGRDGTLMGTEWTGRVTAAKFK